MPNYGASIKKQKENLKFDGNGKYTLHNLHWHAFQISCLTPLLSWWKGNTFLVSSRKRNSHCGYRRLNDSGPRSTVLFLPVANYWKFIRLQMPFLLSKIDSKIGRERSLKYLLQTEKKNWFGAQWVQLDRMRRSYHINLFQASFHMISSLSISLRNTGFISSRVSLSSLGQGASLSLAGQPSSDGVIIKISLGVDNLLHRPALNPIVSY